MFEYLYTGDYLDNLLNNLEGKVALTTYRLNVLIFKLLDNSILLKDPYIYALANIFFLENLKALYIAKLK